MPEFQQIRENYAHQGSEVMIHSFENHIARAAPNSRYCSYETEWALGQAHQDPVAVKKTSGSSLPQFHLQHPSQDCPPMHEQQPF